MNPVLSHALGPLPEAALANVEQQLGVGFPSDYRAFMLEHNGGRPKPAAFDIQWPERLALGEDWRSSLMSWFFFISDDPVESLIEMNTVDFKGRIPEDTVAIGRDAGGNLILLGVRPPREGQVLFWVKDAESGDGSPPGYDNVGFVAPSFEAFLNLLR